MSEDRCTDPNCTAGTWAAGLTHIHPARPTIHEVVERYITERKAMSTMVPDPEDPSVWFIGSAAEGQFGAQVGIATMTNVHPETACAGRPCVVHRPSDHALRDWPLNWRDDRGLMERICPHGVGHPDPDDALYHFTQGRAFMGVHGCDIDPLTNRPCCHAERNS